MTGRLACLFRERSARLNAALEAHQTRCQPIEREKAPVRRINAGAPIMATPLSAPDTTKA